jgi:hypothetical protein
MHLVEKFERLQDAGFISKFNSHKGAWYGELWDGQTCLFLCNVNQGLDDKFYAGFESGDDYSVDDLQQIIIALNILNKEI